MARARGGDVATSALCLAAVLHLDVTSPEAAAGARILAHLAEDIRALRSAYVEDK